MNVISIKFLVPLKFAYRVLRLLHDILEVYFIWENGRRKEITKKIFIANTNSFISIDIFVLIVI